MELVLPHPNVKTKVVLLMETVLQDLECVAPLLSILAEPLWQIIVLTFKIQVTPHLNPLDLAHLLLTQSVMIFVKSGLILTTLI